MHKFKGEIMKLCRRSCRQAAQRAIDTIARTSNSAPKGGIPSSPTGDEELVDRMMAVLEDCRVREPAGPQLTNLTWNPLLPPETASVRNASGMPTEFQLGQFHRVFTDPIIVMILHQNKAMVQLVTDTTSIGVLRAVHKLCTQLSLTASNFRGLVPTDDKYVWGISTDSQPFRAKEALMFTEPRANLIGPVPSDPSDTIPLVCSDWQRVWDYPVIVEIYDRTGKWLFALKPFSIAQALEEVCRAVSSLGLDDRKVASFTIPGAHRCKAELQSYP
jgi:hypothetical protein